MPYNTIHKFVPDNAHLLSLPNEVIEALKVRFPIIKEETFYYKGEEIHTVKTENVIFCRKDLDVKIKSSIKKIFLNVDVYLKPYLIKDEKGKRLYSLLKNKR